VAEPHAAPSLPGAPHEAPVTTETSGATETLVVPEAPGAVEGTAVRNDTAAQAAKYAASAASRLLADGFTLEVEARPDGSARAKVAPVARVAVGDSGTEAGRKLAVAKTSLGAFPTGLWRLFWTLCRDRGLFRRTTLSSTRWTAHWTTHRTT
jgi:hypothetical protein